MRERRSDVLYTKNLIIKSIRNSEPDGRHTLEIVKDIRNIKRPQRCSRNTISIRCKELQYQDLAITRKNTHSPYHLTKKMYKDPGMTAFLFQKQAEDKIRDGDMWISDNSRFCSIRRCENIKRTFYDAKSSANDDVQSEFEQLVLFEYGSRVGALILYAMLQAIQPKSEKKHDVLKIRKETIPVRLKTREQKYEAAKSWIESINTNAIFKQFSQLPMIRQKLLPSATTEELEELKKLKSSNEASQLSYELDKKTFDRLENMFSGAYPQFYKKLMNIKKDTVKTKEYIYGKKRLYLQKVKQDPKHVKCNGELLQEVKIDVNGNEVPIVRIDLDGNEVQQCKKCHRWIDVKLK